MIDDNLYRRKNQKIQMLIMGCEESNIANRQNCNQIKVIKRKKSYRESLNITFSQFVKGSIAKVFEEYTFTDWINRKQNSVVRWAVHKRSTVKRVVKIIKRNQISEKRAMKQISCLRKLDHPNIIKIYEYFIEKDFLYLFFQPVPNAILLYDPIIGPDNQVLEQIKSVFEQLLSAIKHCHSHGITHFNLNPSNILIQKSSGQDVKIFVKLIGFGEAQFSNNSKLRYDPMINSDKENNIPSSLIDFKVKENNCIIFSKDMIPKEFQSPEITNQGNLQKHDIWCCGVLFKKMMMKSYGVSKFVSLPFENLKTAIKQRTNSKEQVSNIIEIMTKMLQKQPQERYSAVQCLSHPYFEADHKMNPWKISQIYRNLHNFEIKQKFRTFMTMYLIFKESTIHDQTQYLTEFYNLDSNKDGMLQYDELLNGLKNHFHLNENQAREYVNIIFEKLDINKNGCLEYSQFLLGTMNVAQILEKKSINNLFNQIDKNQDGLIEESQIKQLLQDWGPMQHFIRQVFEKNADRRIQGKLKISRDQFENIITLLYKKGNFKLS